MRYEEIKALFDQQAAGYDKQWAGMAPTVRRCASICCSMRCSSTCRPTRGYCAWAPARGRKSRTWPRAFRAGVSPRSTRPGDARCVPSAHGATAALCPSGCDFHEGYLDTPAPGAAYDGATCFLVSQFLLEPAVRSAFFDQIAQPETRRAAGQCRPGGGYPVAGLRGTAAWLDDADGCVGAERRCRTRRSLRP